MSAMRTAYMASAGRKAVAASSGTAAKLADSELGALGEKLFNSQFSQSQETESDDYGLAFMQKHKYNVKALESVFRKLASLSGKQGGSTRCCLPTLIQVCVPTACATRRWQIRLIEIIAAGAF